jgi:hypothetical protein
LRAQSRASPSPSASASHQYCILELKNDLDAAERLAEERREWVDDAIATREQWCEAFEMVQDPDDGKWSYAPWVAECEQYLFDYVDLLREWNKHIGEFNSMYGERNGIGRPLAASEVQVGEVERMRKLGASLREIAKDTGLSFATVRTVVGRMDGSDRTSRNRAELRRIELKRRTAGGMARPQTDP